jgi:hypothetical protein
LLGHGQEVNELITHLFDAYLNGVTDEEFHRYIENYQNQYDDGVDITPEKLMQNALTKYDTIMQRKETSGETEHRVLALNAETTKSDEMAALMAEISTLEANYAASNKGNNNKANKSNATNKVPEWKKVAPAENEPKTMVKTVNDKRRRSIGVHIIKYGRFISQRNAHTERKVPPATRILLVKRPNARARIRSWFSIEHNLPSLTRTWTNDARAC